MRTINLITILAGFLLLAGVAAAEPPAPYLKDGKITVELKNGTKYEFSANDWKVVPRRTQQDEELDLAVGEAEALLKKQALQPPPEDKKNRVTLHGGVGPTHLNLGVTGNTATTSTGYGFVFGATYSRKVSGDVSLSGTYLSNQTGLVGVGLDF